MSVAPTPPPPVLPPAPPLRGRRLVSVTAILAAVGVVVALVGIGLGVRPLRTPTQDCGTAFTFLLAGEMNEYVDPNDRPAGVTAAEAEANNTDPCQERAGNRALPAGALVLGGTLLGVGALAVESAARYRWARADRKRHLVPASGPPG